MSENQIVNTNADVQESPENGTTATTKEPVQTVTTILTGALTSVTFQLTTEEKLKYDAVYGCHKAITDGEMMEGAVVALTKLTL
jgi:hypothetical protein